MKLIWHIVKKDLVRDRWALLLWASLFAAQVGLGVVALQNDGTDAPWVTYLQLGNAGLVGLQAAMGYILVARLVQADALVGTSVFWVTRPISPARLLAAKALGALLLFAALPVLLLLPWWLSCDFGWRDILWTAVETFSWQLLIIAPAFLVASLTDDLGRVLLWTLLLVMGVFAWMSLLQSSLATSLIGPARDWNSGILFTRLWLAGIFAGASAAAVTFHQFLTRHFVRSVVLAALSLGLIALIGRVWPWDWATFFADVNRPALAQAPAGLVEGVSLQVEPAKVTGANGPRGWQPMLCVAIRARGVPADMSISGDNAVQTWRWVNGPTFTRGGSYFGSFPAAAVLREAMSLPTPQDDPETKQWIQAYRDKANADRVARGLAPRRPFTPHPLPSGEQLLQPSPVLLPDSILAKLRTQPPAYENKIQCILLHPEIVVELPLKLNARGSGRSQSFCVRRLTRKDGLAHTDMPGNPMPNVTLVTTAPSLQKNGLWQSAPFRQSWHHLRSQMMDVNHSTGEIGWVYGNDPEHRDVQIGGVVIDWDSLWVGPIMVIRNGQWVPKDPQWMDHTTLVLLSDREVARFTRVAKTEKFEIGPGDEDGIDGGPTSAKPIAPGK